MKKNYLLIGGAVLAVYYFFLRKKSPSGTTMTMPKQAAVMQPKIITYPAGLVEGDYAKFGTDATVYMIFKGQKLPLTEAWWNANAWNQWDTVKLLSPAVGLQIPTGNTL
jgi:hypothetical protein